MQLALGSRSGHRGGRSPCGQWRPAAAWPIAGRSRRAIPRSALGCNSKFELRDSGPAQWSATRGSSDSAQRAEHRRPQQCGGVLRHRPEFSARPQRRVSRNRGWPAKSAEQPAIRLESGCFGGDKNVARTAAKAVSSFQVAASSAASKWQRAARWAGFSILRQHRLGAASRRASSCSPRQVRDSRFFRASMSGMHFRAAAASGRSPDRWSSRAGRPPGRRRGSCPAQRHALDEPRHELGPWLACWARTCRQP